MYTRRIYSTMETVVEAKHSRRLKGTINTRLTHRPLVIYTQPVVTFASLITIDKSLEEHTTPLSLSPYHFLLEIVLTRRKNLFLDPHKYWFYIDT